MSAPQIGVLILKTPFALITAIYCVGAHSADHWIYAPPNAAQIPYVRSQENQPIVYNIPVFNSYGNGVINSVPAWNVGDFTGLTVPVSQRATFERTVSADWIGSTAVQAYQKDIGVQIHTYSAPAAEPRSLKTINYGIDFSGTNKIKPFAQFGANAKYCIAHSTAVPDYYSEGAIGYIIPRIFFVDEVSGKSIIFGATLWDSRTTAPNEWIFFDGNHPGATNSYVANSFYGQGTNYVTQQPYSANTRVGTKWNDNIWYSYCVTRQNILNVKNYLESMGTPVDINPERMSVNAAGIEFEMATNINGVIKNGWMAARIKEFNLFIHY